MDQKEFSNYVIARLLQHFPQFTSRCIERPQDVIDIDYNSSNKKLTLWMTTQDKELTIGFTGLEKLKDWHTHMSLFGANSPDEEIKVAIDLIEDIIFDRTAIIYSSVSGFFLGDLDEAKEFQETNELIESIYWSEL